MPSFTPNLNLSVYNATTDGSQTFLTFRSDLAGVTSSNMTKLDTFAGNITGSIVALQANKPIIRVPGVYVSPNYYEATVPDITSYDTDMIIDFIPDTTTNGTVTLSINAPTLGVRTMVKLNTGGSYVNFSGSELMKNHENLFRYDGSQWVWVSGASADTVHISGSANNVVMINSDNTLITSGYPFSYSGSLANSFVVSGSAGKISDGWTNRYEDGWYPANETWTFSGSAGAPTFTMTVPGDKTGKYQAGMKVKLTQSTVKYFVITDVAFSASTTLTLYGGTDYALTSAAISGNYYSIFKTPFGFPQDRTKWREKFTSGSTIQSQSTPTASQWYNLGSSLLSVPIGQWYLGYEVAIQLNDTTSAAYGIASTLSTANNTESDTEMNSSWGFTSTSFKAHVSKRKADAVTLASATTYYLNTQTVSSNVDTIYNRNDQVLAIIFAECAYL